MRNDDYDFVADALFTKSFIELSYKLCLAFVLLVAAGACLLFKIIKKCISDHKEKKALEDAQSIKEVTNND